jgi:Na+(H+)/acetate symporter ActP
VAAVVDIEEAEEEEEEEEGVVSVAVVVVVLVVVSVVDVDPEVTAVQDSSMTLREKRIGKFQQKKMHLCLRELKEITK